MGALRMSSGFWPLGGEDELGGACDDEGVGAGGCAG